jgi:AcrR family transcriptional regulator
MKPVTARRSSSADLPPELDPEPDDTTDVVADAPRRGRPLATDRSSAILAATIDLVDESGYDRLRIQDVATRAGVGLATIYRRWPTKQSLFVEALRAKSVDLPDSGDVRADLVTIYARMTDGLQGDGGQLLPGCLAVGRDEPEILQALRDNALSEMRSHVRGLIARVVGEDDPDLDLRVDFGPGIILQRAMLYGERIDDPTVLERMADLALRPAVPTADAAPSRAKRRRAKKA